MTHEHKWHAAGPQSCTECGITPLEALHALRRLIAESPRAWVYVNNEMIATAAPYVKTGWRQVALVPVPKPVEEGDEA